MKYFVIAICLMFSTLAFAELPPPGTARKGKVTVDPYNLGKPSEYDLEQVKVVERAKARKFNRDTKREVERLKKRIAELERQLEEKPVVVAAPRRAEPVQQVVKAPSKKNRVTLLAGYGPSHLSDERLGSDTGNSVKLKQGPLAGLGYSRLITESVSIGAQVVIPTYEDRSGDWIKRKQDRVSGMAVVGFDF